MPKEKPLFKVIYFFIFTAGFASCSPRVPFDFRTSRPPEVFEKTSREEHPAPLTALADLNGNASRDAEEREIPSVKLLSPGPAAIHETKEKIFPVEPSAFYPRALVSGNKKEILIFRQEWKRSVRPALKRERESKGTHLRKKVADSLSSLAQNPFNQGILAVFLILGLGTAIIVLGSLLPSLGSILAWVLGVMVLLVGVAFLALTLMGFSVRIIG